jgi:hypothetical protein
MGLRSVHSEVPVPLRRGGAIMGTDHPANLTLPFVTPNLEHVRRVFALYILHHHHASPRAPPGTATQYCK